MIATAIGILTLELIGLVILVCLIACEPALIEYEDKLFERFKRRYSRKMARKTPPAVVDGLKAARTKNYSSIIATVNDFVNNANEEEYAWKTNQAGM